jgi:uncharacterized protein involved in response to NO
MAAPHATAVSGGAAPPAGFALWNLGFRPFFLGAMLHAWLSIAHWTGAVSLGWWPAAPLAHAHEMIFGFSAAVIAGFLLTAIGNWTGLQTLSGRPLAALFACWAAARLLWLAGLGGHPAAAAADLLFGSGLLAAASGPVVRARQWRQWAILLTLAGLPAANAAAYFLPPEAVRSALLAGLYLTLLLVLLMLRRVLPFFIERAVAGARLRQRAWLDTAILSGFPAFALADLAGWRWPAAGLAAVLLPLFLLRLRDWHHPGLWLRPLLWVLYLGQGAITAGLALRAVQGVATLPPAFSLHAFAYGGLGLLTAGMMARVILGHTGRSVLEPPDGLCVVFTLLTAGAVARVLLPLLHAPLTVAWVLAAQLFWLLAFTLLLVLYARMLWQPRADGRPG